MFLIAKKTTDSKVPSARAEYNKKLSEGVSIRRRFLKGNQESIKFTIGIQVYDELGLKEGDKLSVFYGTDEDKGIYKIRAPEEGHPTMKLTKESHVDSSTYLIISTYTFPEYMRGGENSIKNAFCDFSVDRGCITVTVPKDFMNKDHVKKVSIADPLDKVAKEHNMTTNMMKILRECTEVYGGHNVIKCVPKRGGNMVLKALQKKGLVTEDHDPKITDKGFRAIIESNQVLRPQHTYE